ncbi:hypothetical protein C7999DRAFT_34702 [Corynascus novoguineensis]|uniref:Uncharacterized protein n=1 Tax=Corynascus novoguineensis TaxID=1126955 RepID=A0AAN7HCP9_9PEZI|nr:hypothetical protein C7999DRAFT_34702 [Corynascus novoguineensis]
MKFTAVVLALTTAVAALPTTDTNTNADGSVSIRAIKKWQAKGGCKADWAGRCKT